MNRILPCVLILAAACSGPDPDPKSADPYGRYLGVREMGTGPGARETALLLVRDPHPLAVIGALQTLADLGDPGFLLYVGPVVADRKQAVIVRVEGCITLARLRNPEGIPWLVEALKDESSEWLRRDAAKALAAFGPRPEVITALVEAAGDPEPGVAYMAHRKLVELTGKTEVSRTKEAWIRALGPP